MAKAVLVMDMPESCVECNLNYMIPLGSRLRCHAFALGKAIDSNTREKPKWCPLRELPERVPGGDRSFKKYIKNIYVRKIQKSFKKIKNYFQKCLRWRFFFTYTSVSISAYKKYAKEKKNNEKLSL